VGDDFRTFEDLACWQACRRLRLFVAGEVVPLLPGDEKFLLRPQLLDAARSTTANVAEGYGRYHYMDTAKFCGNARGSCYEVLDHLIAAHDDGLIPATVLAEGRALVQGAVRLLNGYIRYLRRRKSEDGVREDASTYGKAHDNHDDPDAL
jgi:four helix bundle protein